MKSRAFSKEVVSWYNFGALLLFLGLLWMFLPHAVHTVILSKEQETEHIVHVFQGAVAALGGLGIMMLSQKYRKTH